MIGLDLTVTPIVCRFYLNKFYTAPRIFRWIIRRTRNDFC